MNRFRSILLSGLVALLMVGFVNAGDVNYDTQVGQTAEATAGIYIYLGVWEDNTSQCLHLAASDCLKIGISIDFKWIKNLFT